MRRLHTLPPFWNVRTSGSRPRLPIKMTLLTDPAMFFPFVAFALLIPGSFAVLARLHVVNGSLNRMRLDKSAKMRI